MATVISADESYVEVTVVESTVAVNLCENVVAIETATTGPQGPRGTQVLSGNSDPSPSIGLLGDQYINTDTGKLFGPKTVSGWGEGVYLGSNDPNDLGQVYTQNSPSTVWNIAHTLAFVPNIIVVDPDGYVVEGDFQYISPTHISATFSNPISGKAYLS